VITEAGGDRRSPERPQQVSWPLNAVSLWIPHKITPDFQKYIHGPSVKNLCRPRPACVVACLWKRTPSGLWVLGIHARYESSRFTSDTLATKHGATVHSVRRPRYNEQASKPIDFHRVRLPLAVMFLVPFNSRTVATTRCFPFRPTIPAAPHLRECIRFISRFARVLRTCSIPS